jgi:hypothetical protein
MGHIKEPKGVDFIIQSRQLTKVEELAISEHIKKYKLQNNSRSRKPKQTIKKKKVELK